MSEYIVGIDGNDDCWYTGEEIVRCCDCRWAEPDDNDFEYCGEYRCDMWSAVVSADGFCFRGMDKGKERIES